VEWWRHAQSVGGWVGRTETEAQKTRDKPNTRLCQHTSSFRLFRMIQPLQDRGNNRMQGTSTDDLRAIFQSDKVQIGGGCGRGCGCRLSLRSRDRDRCSSSSSSSSSSSEGGVRCCRTLRWTRTCPSNSNSNSSSRKAGRRRRESLFFFAFILAAVSRPVIRELRRPLCEEFTRRRLTTESVCSRWGIEMF